MSSESISAKVFVGVGGSGKVYDNITIGTNHDRFFDEPEFVGKSVFLQFIQGPNDRPLIYGDATYIKAEDALKLSRVLHQYAIKMLAGDR